MTTITRDTITGPKHVYPEELQVKEWVDKLWDGILKVKPLSAGNCSGREVWQLDLIKQNYF